MLTNRIQKSWQFAAVLVPFSALLLWTLKVHFVHSGGTTLRVKIIGYDPVDLLSGHYLRFRYDFGSLPICAEAVPRASVCICVDLPSDDGVTMLANQKVECDAGRNVCRNLIKGTCQHSTFLTGSERFYFPEQFAGVLARVPEDSEAEIKVQVDGSIALTDIWVKSQTILEYARERL